MFHPKPVLSHLETVERKGGETLNAVDISVLLVAFVRSIHSPRRDFLYCTVLQLGRPLGAGRWNVAELRVVNHRRTRRIELSKTS